MTGPSKVIVLDPDVRSGRQIQLGFQREGVPAEIATVTGDTFQLPTDGTGLVVVGGVDRNAVELVRKARAALQASHADAPIVFAGRGVARKELETAGADEIVQHPAYLRDVVTIGRLLVGQPATHRTHLVGNLSEITGVLTLVRALSALGRSAVLTLIRGLRRGEVRFFEGEVTSAQVGLIHGQAAFHQLLLWTDARFDFHHEDIVRRQQIPLASEELFADAERFLAGVRDSSGSLSPSMVLEQDVARIQQLGKQIPTEVHGVLRMFDGHRVLADVLEDSPYRVFETLRVAQRAVDVGLLRKATGPRPKATWRAVLAIEEWLVGAETKEDVVARGAVDNTVPVAKNETGKSKKFNRRQRKKRRANTPLPVPTTTAPPPMPAKAADIDWGALVPRSVGAEVGPLAGIVPAAQRSGEIVLPAAPSRDEPREKLESLMDTRERDRIFPSDLGEPTVVFDEAPSSDDAARAAAALAIAKRERERAEAEAAEQRLHDEAQIKVRALVERQRRDSEEIGESTRAGEKLLEDVAARTSTSPAASTSPAPTTPSPASTTSPASTISRDPDSAAADKTAADKAAADKAAADTAAADKAAADKAAAHQAAANRAAADAMAAVRVVADARAAADAKVLADTKAALDARGARRDEQTADRELREHADSDRKKSSTDSRDLVRALLDEERGDRSGKTPSIIVEETPTATVAVRDHVSVTSTERTARVTATPEAVVSEVPFLAVPIAPQPIEKKRPIRPHDDDDDNAVTRTFVKPGAEPDVVDDEPSDGVIRSHSEEPAPRPMVPRRPPPGEIPLDDRPAQTTGEIRTPERPPVMPPAQEPSILVTDLQAAHSAASAVTASQVSAPPTQNAATPQRAAEVQKVQRDATGAFTQIEEEFFRAGQEHTGQTPKLASSSDSFDDLDEGYQRQGFWDRLLGRKPPKR